jgi:hypothetical protein
MGSGRYLLIAIDDVLAIYHSVMRASGVGEFHRAQTCHGVYGALADASGRRLSSMCLIHARLLGEMAYVAPSPALAILQIFFTFRYVTSAH